MSFSFLFNLISAYMGLVRDVYDLDLNKKVECLDACQTQLYKLSIANANYATGLTFQYTKDFCYIVKKLLRYSEKRSLEKVQPRLFELLQMLKVS